MKKIGLLLIMLIGFVAFAGGCSCNKEVYKFSSVTLSGIEEKTYTCNKDDKKDSSVKAMCENFEELSITLKGEDKMIVDFPMYNMNEVEEEYKIEEGYIYLKENGEWMNIPFAKYNGDSIVLTMTGVTVTLKK